MPNDNNKRLLTTTHVPSRDENSQKLSFNRLMSVRENKHEIHWNGTQAKEQNIMSHTRLSGAGQILISLQICND